MSEATHDITMFRGREADLKVRDRDPAALFFNHPPGKMCVGDSGYAGEPDKIVVSRPEHLKDFKKFLARVKSRQETFNARLKVFRVLTLRFHHGTSSANKMKMHQMCVEMIAVMVQYSMENGAPLFEN